MPDVTVSAASALDFERFAELQREAFAEIAAVSGTPMTQTSDYYRWKYRTPFGEAKIALVHQDGEPVAANSMYPLRVVDGAESLDVWESCDTATVPKARGKGYFMTCLQALKKELGPNQIFFGFPNSNSIHGFEKFGWSQHGWVDASLRIFPGPSRSKDFHVVELKAFDARQDILARKWADLGGPTLDRSAAYMNWRYFRHPVNSYAAFAYEQKGDHRGVVVVRSAQVKNRQVTLVMDLLALDSKTRRSLFSTAAAWGRRQGAPRVLLMNNTVSRARALANLFAPIPRWALRTKHVLMGAATGPHAEAVLNRRWRVQLGDGDGF